MSIVTLVAITIAVSLRLATLYPLRAEALRPQELWSHQLNINCLSWYLELKCVFAQHLMG